MNIKILDSWLKEYLKTDATPKQIAEHLSLTSVSIERVEKWKNDHLYDIEMMTNRPDLMSVVGIAREAAAVLPQSGIEATFLPPKLKQQTSHPGEATTSIGSKDSIAPARHQLSPQATAGGSLQNDNKLITIQNDPKLVHRICAVILEVTVKPSPKEVQDRLESSDIRSLNNLIDITNYVMRTIGHPAHVFDFDRLGTNKLIIRESKKGEKITTLDGKTYILPGGDIVADAVPAGRQDGKGRIVDLIGIMGLENSVVTDDTKRILFFIDNNDVTHIRNTSMKLGIRTEAAQMNEKGIDPEIAMDALLFGIKLYQDLADGKVVSEIIDIYPNQPQPHSVSIPFEKINEVIGIDIPRSTATSILKNLGFEVTISEDTIEATVPSFRSLDINIPEDLIEEIARVYGYDKIPSSIPTIQPSEVTPLENNEFYWEERVRNALKYWGFTESYTYPMVSEDMYEGDTKDAVKLANPLGEEFVYMRRSLIPSLLKVVEENKRFDTIRIFEIANVYEKQKKALPSQLLHLAGVIKEKKTTFFTAKGILEQLFIDLGIRNVIYRPIPHVGFASEVMLGKTVLGTIEVLDEGLINFELNFELLIQHATTKKMYQPLSKFPPVIEDLAFEVPSQVATGDIMEAIEKADKLIVEVSLLDKYKDTRTFHVLYQDPTKNLTSTDVEKVRKKIIEVVKTKFHAHLKK